MFTMASITETYGNPDASAAIDGPKYPSKEYWDHRPVSLDYYNNYMTNFRDNAFEVDGSMHNVRVMRNLMINNASQPYCNQSVIGGPVYWIRNVSFNSPGDRRGLRAALEVCSTTTPCSVRNRAEPLRTRIFRTI